MGMKYYLMKLISRFLKEAVMITPNIEGAEKYFYTMDYMGRHITSFPKIQVDINKRGRFGKVAYCGRLTVERNENESSEEFVGRAHQKAQEDIAARALKNSELWREQEQIYKLMNDESWAIVEKLKK